MGSRGTIGILTGGGDVPGLNPAIRALTLRALREGFRVLGIRNGWSGLVDTVPDPGADNTAHVHDLTAEMVNRAARTGGTLLHTSRTSPSKLPDSSLPDHLRQDTPEGKTHDVTPAVLKVLDFLGIDVLVPIGGDDTLSYAQRLNQEGFKVVAIPKTMDNDVPGTDYCIGFSTCVTRTIDLANRLRTSAGSHERFLVIEVFGRYAGFTALVPTLAGAADRCLIPEYPFDMERLAEVLVADRESHRSKYAVVIVSEGAHMTEDSGMTFEGTEKDQYGHRKLGGIGDRVSMRLKEISADLNNGRSISTVTQRLGYLVRCGEPDALDAIVPTAFGNLALELILGGNFGRLVCVRKGLYGNVPLEVVSGKKVVDVERYYDTHRLRPAYTTFADKPLLITAT